MAQVNSNSVSFVREKMLDEAAPPAGETGAIKWVRENLLSSTLNSVLTVLSLLIVYFALSGLLPWLANSVWTAGSLSECREVLAVNGHGAHGGACFAVVSDRWLQLLFGFYPSDQYWRPILTFVLFFVALAPILFSQVFPRALLAFTAVYPFLAVWLIWGGSFWTPLLVGLGFVVAYAAYRVASTMSGSIVAVIAAILAAVVWWGFATQLIDETLHRMVGDSRIEAQSATMAERIEELEPQIAALEEEKAVIDAQLAEAVTVKDALLEDALVQRENDPGSDAFDASRAAFLEQMDTLQDLRHQSTTLSVAAFRLNETLRTDRALLANIEQLEDQNTRIPELTQQASDLRAALPSEVRGIILAEGAANASEDAQAALNEVLAIETELATVRNQVTSTYADLGRTGLRPVDSREIGGFMLGVIIGVSGIILSLPLGILLALGRQSPMFIINKVCVGFIEVIRGVPLIVWLITASLLLNYFLPPGTNFDLMLRVIIMVTLFSAAYIAEVIRGGLAALPKGQYEGADSLGLDYWQSMRLIVLPQALKISIPGIVNTFIGLFKDTTLVVFIGLLDPIGLANAIRATTDWNGVYWELFVFIGLLFFVCCYSMGRYSHFLENKLQREHR